MGPWASLPARGLRAGTPAGHRPAGGRAQRGHRSPGTFQLPSGPDQMLLPCVGLGRGRGPSPPGAADPPRDRRAARSPEPASPGGEVSGVWVCPPAMAELAGQDMNVNNGSRVCSTSQFSLRFTVCEVLFTLCSALCCTRLHVDKVLSMYRGLSHPQLRYFSQNQFPRQPGECDSGSLLIGGEGKAQSPRVIKMEPRAEVCSLGSLHFAASSCC